MMMTIGPNYLIALLIPNILLLGIACITIVRFERRCRQMEDFWGSPTGVALADDKDDASKEFLRIARRLENRIGQLQRAVKVMEISPQKPPAPVERSLPIENAVRMAKQGASIEDLTKSCGLNIAEASLMHRLHGQVQLATTTTN